MRFSLFILCLLFFDTVFCQNLQLNIKGKNNYETEIIDSTNYIKLHKNLNSINKEVDSVYKLLQKKGFIENKRQKTFKLNDSSFTTNIYLGKRFKFIRVFFDSSQINKKLIKSFASNASHNYFELPIGSLEKQMKYLNLKISENGYPFSKTTLTNITLKDSLLHAFLILERNSEKRKIDKILIKGYEKFPKSFLRHYLKLKQNEILNLSEINSKIKQLSNLNFANSLKSPEVLFTKDSTTLYLYMNKLKSNSFDGFLGFGTNEENKQIQFDGYLNLNLINNLNYGESFKLYYKSDENEQQTFEINTTLPYLFKSPIGLNLSLKIFKKDSTFLTSEQTARIHYQLNSRNKIYTGISKTTSNNLLNNTENTSIQDYNSTQFLTSYEFANPTKNNNLLFPMKSIFNIEAKFGNRLTNSTKQKQIHLGINTYKIFQLNTKNSFYVRNISNILFSDNYYENELYLFGGITSIRGFEENSIYANLYTLLNTEYRYQVAQNLYIHTIFDSAYFENNLTQTKENLFGYGIGLGLLTNSGVFRLNFANGKSKYSNFSLSNSKIHISLTSSF